MTPLDLAVLALLFVLAVWGMERALHVAEEAAPRADDSQFREAAAKSGLRNSGRRSDQS